MLQKSTITIPLGLGVNTKTDDKLVEQGQFNLVCENAVFDKIGAVKKRQAFESESDLYYDPALSAGTSGSVASLVPTCISAIGESIFLRNTQGKYVYQHEAGNILGPGQIPEAKITTVMIYPGKSTVDHTDCEYDADENVIIAVARDGSLSGSLSSTGIEQSTLFIYDVAKGSTVATPPISSGGFADTFGFVRCGCTRVAGASYYYNVVSDTNNDFKIKIFNRYGQDYGVSYSVAGVQNGGATDKGPIAACRASDGQSYYFIMATTTANLGRFIAMSGTSKTHDVTFAFTGGGLASMTSASARFDSGSGLIEFVYNGSRRIFFNPDGTIATADAAVTGLSVSLGASLDQEFSGVITGEHSTGLVSFNGTTQYTENPRCNIVSDSRTISSVPVVIVRGGIAGDDEGTYFALPYTFSTNGAGPRTFAAISRDLALDNDQNNFLKLNPTRLARVGSTTVVAALPRVVSSNGVSSTSGLALVFIEISQDYKSNSRSIIKNIHLQGGFVSEFDGQKVFENGFLMPGPLPVLNVAGAGTLTGTYSYRLVKKYIDSSGQVTRSAPSAAVSTGAITSKEVVITVGQAEFGVKPEDCIIEIYRTKTTGSTFYFVDEVNINLYTTTAVYTDEIADSIIGSNRILYTTGDVLANDPGPACKHVSQWGNRIILSGLEDENEIAYSKEKLFGECVNFSDFFRIRFDTAQYNISGGVIATCGMDDKLIVFKKNSIFYVSGTGPVETGAGSFTEPVLISSEAGCTEPRSVVLTPRGVMFKGEKGIYLLGRGLETQYIGAPVEQFNNQRCKASVHDEKKNLINFILTSAILSYDYYSEQWSIISDRSAIDAEMVGPSMAIIEGNSSLVQDGTDFTDNSGLYSIKVRTPWIKVSGIQDFSRIWSCTILGKYKSAHELTVNVRYDYDIDTVDTYTISPTVSDKQYEYRIHLGRQKCAAIQFEIFDSEQIGESMELTALTLEVGLKLGSTKLAASRKY